MAENDATAAAVSSSPTEKQLAPAFACHPGYALDRELLPELEAAVAFLQDEVAQLRLGKHDHRLQELIEGPPLPGDKFQTLLSVWKVPAIPAELAEMFKMLQQVQLREQQQQKEEGDEAKTETIDVTAGDEDEVESVEGKASVVEISDDSAEETDTADAKEAIEIEDEDEKESSSELDILAGAAEDAKKSQSEQEAEAAALASLKALRKSMLLDVLSKIISVAKSKGVDPAMFSSRKEIEAGFMDLETISSDVQSGEISEWGVFADRVYEFCQHVIADAEKREQQEAKQKGVELLHFARTLTETLRKASVKKEESLLLGMEGKASFVAGGGVTPSPRSEDVPAKPVSESQEEKEDVAKESAVETDRKAKTPPPAHTQASPKRPSVVVDPLTPNRISARIRQRGSSFSDLASPQATGHTPRNDDAAATTETDTRGRKRPRAPSNASSATATPPPAAAAAVVSVNTASEDDNMSESESQISASEAESNKRRGSRARETASASSSAQTTPVKRAKTRKRRPVLPATRMSSRQQKRRAARAKAAAESGETAAGDDDGEGDDGKEDGSENNDGDNDTAQGEDDEDDNNNNTNSDAAGGAESASPAPVLLTKAGRPRKKPGRKPAAWKNKADGK